MTASAHGGEHVTSAAASLASGGGVAAVATNHSDGSTVTLGPLLHGMAPDGSLLVLVGGTAVPPRLSPLTLRAKGGPRPLLVHRP